MDEQRKQPLKTETTSAMNGGYQKLQNKDCNFIKAKETAPKENTSEAHAEISESLPVQTSAAAGLRLT